MKKNIYITIGGFYVGSTALLDALDDNNFSVQFGDFDLLRSQYGLLKLGNTKSKLSLIRCYLNIILECNNILFCVIKLFIKRRVLKKYSERQYYHIYNTWQHSYKSFISIIKISNNIFLKRLLCKDGLLENKIDFEKLIYLYSIYSNKKVFHNCHNLNNYQISDYKLTTSNKYNIKYIVVTRDPLDQLSTALDLHVIANNDNRFATVINSKKNYYEDHIFRLKYVTTIALNMARQRLVFLEELSKRREIEIIAFEELVSSNNYRSFLSKKFPEHKFCSNNNFQFVQKESSKNLLYKSKTLSREKIYSTVPKEIEELTKINKILKEKFE